MAIYSDSDYKRFCLGNQPFVSVSSIRFFFNAAIVSWFFLKSSNCLYAFSLNIFNLSILGTSCLIKSAFVSSRLISTTNSSAEAKSLILGVFPFIPFSFLHYAAVFPNQAIFKISASEAYVYAISCGDNVGVIKNSFTASVWIR